MPETQKRKDLSRILGFVGVGAWRLGGHAAGVSSSPAPLGFRTVETSWGRGCTSSGAACR